MKDNPTEFGPEDEYISAINRTAKEMAPPPGVDTKALAEKVAKEYWAAREEVHRQGRAVRWPRSAADQHYEETTARLARAVAAKMGDTRWSSWKPYPGPALWAVLPGLIYFLAVYFQFRPNAAADETAARLSQGSVVVVAALLCLMIYVVAQYISRATGSRRLPYAASALVGGFVGTTLLAALVFYQAKRAESLSTALARSNEFAQAVSFGLTGKKLAETVSFGLVGKEMSELAFSTMERLRNGEGIPNVNRLGGDVPLQTEIKSQTEVKYIATLDQPRGSLIAQVGPERGTLYWKYEDGKIIEAEFLVGRVVKEERGGFILQSSDGPNTWVGFKENIVDKPRPGDQIIVVIDTETNNAIMVRKIYQ